MNRFVIESLYTDEKVQQDGVKLLDKGFLENILTASYIDPDFKNYSYIDDIVTQRIFKIIAQDEDPVMGVKDLKDDIRESLTYIR